jgi:hypothetical protein
MLVYGSAFARKEVIGSLCKLQYDVFSDSNDSVSSIVMIKLKLSH